mgnify:CR=1 FL=1
MKPKKTTLRLATLAASFSLLLATMASASAAEWGTLKGRLVVEGDPGKPDAINVNKDVEFFVQYPVIRSCPFDREDMLELLGNLLENACKWTEAIVSLNVIYHDRQLCFTVEDDGPGVDDEKLKILAQRGTRIDESTVGYGLGLAIVDDIVKHYDGTLTFRRSKKYSGLLVNVYLMAR